MAAVTLGPDEGGPRALPSLKKYWERAAWTEDRIGNVWRVGPSSRSRARRFPTGRARPSQQPQGWFLVPQIVRKGGAAEDWTCPMHCWYSSGCSIFGISVWNAYGRGQGFGSTPGMRNGWHRFMCWMGRGSCPRAASRGAISPRFLALTANHFPMDQRPANGGVPGTWVTFLLIPVHSCSRATPSRSIRGCKPNRRGGFPELRGARRRVEYLRHHSQTRIPHGKNLGGALLRGPGATS